MMQRLVLVLLLWCAALAAQAQTPMIMQPQLPAASAALESNHIFSGLPGRAISELTVTIGATSGYVVLLDTATAPSNGAITPKWCWPIASNGTNGGISATFNPPWQFNNGIVAAFSTTGCYALTLSATASFYGSAQ